jgi:hypothetical protein
MFNKAMKFSAINAVCDLHEAGKMSESDLALALTALDADYYNKTVNDETTSNTVVEESESIRAA